MQVRFDFKDVLECWDRDILVPKTNFDNMLTQHPIIDQMIKKTSENYAHPQIKYFWYFNPNFWALEHTIIREYVFSCASGNFVAKFIRKF